MLTWNSALGSRFERVRRARAGSGRARGCGARVDGVAEHDAVVAVGRGRVVDLDDVDGEPVGGQDLGDARRDLAGLAFHGVMGDEDT